MASRPRRSRRSAATRRARYSTLTTPARLRTIPPRSGALQYPRAGRPAHADGRSGGEAQALGAPRVRVPVAVPDRARHRLPARVRVLPVAAELRSLHRARLRVRRTPELRGGALP